MIGETAGSYRIVRQIGQGGMGAVYLGRHTMLGRPAAIKVLLPALSQNREMVGRFFNEARAATAIRHPGIVEIYDFGFLPNGAAYIAMEMLEGESLSARLRRQGRLPAGATIEIGRQVAAALHAAHSKAITHRDLKPDNVFLISDPEIGERVKLLDFGIAKLITEDAGNRTRTGMVMGTPVYMSPEQCRGTAALDSRADLYSLGCMLYELLTGRPPFVAESAGDIIAHHLYFQPEPVRMHEASVPEPLEQLIMSLLAKDPAMRPASAADVRAIFDGWRTLASASSGGAMHATPVTAPMPATPSTLPTAPTAPAVPAPVTPAATSAVRGPVAHVAASVPTTLSGSAVSLPPAVGPVGLVGPVKSRRRWLVSASAAVIVVGLAAVVLVMRQPDASTQVAATAPGALGAPAPAPPSPPASSPPAPSPSPSPVAPPPPAPSASLDQPAPSGSEPAPAELSASPDAANKPAANKPIDEPPSRKPGKRVAATSKPAGTATKKARDAVDATPREEPKPAAAIATRPAEPADPIPADRVEAKPARGPEPETSPKSEPKPADGAAAPKPAASKWGRLMGDKAPVAGDYALLEQCKTAAARGDCPAARALAAQLAEKNLAMYRARVMTDAAIAACLSSK